MRRGRTVRELSVRAAVLLALFVLLAPLSATAACNPAEPTPEAADRTSAGRGAHDAHDAQALPAAPAARHDGALVDDCCGHCLPHALAGPPEGPTQASAAARVQRLRLVPAPAVTLAGRIQPCPFARGPPTA